MATRKYTALDEINWQIAHSETRIARLVADISKTARDLEKMVETKDWQGFASGTTITGSTQRPYAELAAALQEQLTLLAAKGMIEREREEAAEASK